RTIIAMPGRLMYDGKDPDLFDHFAVVAQRSSVYTVHDYAAIIEHLVKTWNVANRQLADIAHPEVGAARRAQDWLCRQSEKYLRHADEIAQSLQAQPSVPFSWVNGRKV